MKKSLLLSLALGGAMSANAVLSNTDLANNDYIGEWGRLKLVGTQLSSESGAAIQLKGWSTFSINYDEVVNCLNDEHFAAMKAWGANIVRLACYAENSKGKYGSYQDNAIRNYIKLASKYKMYVLLDWHILEGDGGSGDPRKYLDDAKGFFERNAGWCKQNGYTNVLYEIGNEPIDLSWDILKNYARNILPIIETADPGSIVIVPTRAWDQHPEEAASSPIHKTEFDLGIMYSTHVYTCSHMGDVVPRMRTAAANIPIFVSEWGAVRFDGDGELCNNEANQFLSYMKGGNDGKQLISWCFWAWGEKDEQSNCIKNCSSTLNENNLRPSGHYIVPVMMGYEDPICICFNNDYAYAVQEIPFVAENYGVLNIGYYDVGGDGVSYHDNNSSMYVDPETKDEIKTGDAAKNTEAEHCNAGAIYADLEDKTQAFRYDDCFDITHAMAGLGANWGVPGDGYGTNGSQLHNLCSTEAGEWAIYTIDVKKKGYYTVHCLTNSGTSCKGTIGFSIVGSNYKSMNGNIIRSWEDHDNEDADVWGSFQLEPTPKCGLYPDGTQDPDGAENGVPAASWTCWGWTPCGGDFADDLVVLFKDEGEMKLKLLISPDVKESPGDFSNFLFTFKSDDIPEWEYQSAPETAADMNAVAVYPNPAENDFTVVTDGAANVSIYSASGTMVYNQDVEGDVVVNNSFPAGIYTVRVANAKGVKSMKLVVK